MYLGEFYVVMQLLASDPAPKDGVTVDSVALKLCFLSSDSD